MQATPPYMRAGLTEKQRGIAFDVAAQAFANRYERALANTAEVMLIEGIDLPRTVEVDYTELSGRVCFRVEDGPGDLLVTVRIGSLDPDPLFPQKG